jgi:peptide-methionine (S)-S-oxide reductase
MDKRFEQATLAGGCFWCVEAVFQEVKGVSRVVSGYSGGKTDNPTYDEAHYSDAGHAEAIQITYDPKVISYEQLLQIFYYVHDPTTLNRQGNDVGREYRSIIFYQGEQQKNIAEKVTKNFAAKLWPDPIVTEIIPLEKFWPAESLHQNFYKNNPNLGYCQVIINPKLEKFRKKFESLLK